MKQKKKWPASVSRFRLRARTRPTRPWTSCPAGKKRWSRWPWFSRSNGWSRRPSICLMRLTRTSIPCTGPPWPNSSRRSAPNARWWSPRSGRSCWRTPTGFIGCTWRTGRVGWIASVGGTRSWWSRRKRRKKGLMIDFWLLIFRVTEGVSHHVILQFIVEGGISFFIIGIWEDLISSEILSEIENSEITFGNQNCSSIFLLSIIVGNTHNFLTFWSQEFPSIQ